MAVPSMLILSPRCNLLSLYRNLGCEILLAIQGMYVVFFCFVLFSGLFNWKAKIRGNSVPSEIVPNVQSTWVPAIPFSVGSLIRNAIGFVENSWEHKHTSNIFKSYKVELKKNNKQQMRYTYFVVTFDWMVNSGCYWDFQYLAFSPACCILLRRGGNKNPEELFCEHISATIALQNAFTRKLCKIVENNCITLMEDTSLSGLIQRLKVMIS